MSADVYYRSRVRIERVKGPLRRAYLPGEAEPITFGLHSQLASYYGVDVEKVGAHAATVDYLAAAVGG